MDNVKKVLKTIVGHRLFIPIVCLIVLLMVNLIKTPDFFNISTS